MNIYGWNTACPGSEPYLPGNSPVAAALRNCMIPSLLGGGWEVTLLGISRRPVARGHGVMEDLKPNACTTCCSKLFNNSIRDKLCILWLKLKAQLVFLSLASYWCALNISRLLYFTDLCLRCILCTSPWTRFLAATICLRWGGKKSYKSSFMPFLTRAVCLVQTRC